MAEKQAAAEQVTAVEHVYEPAHGREVRVRGYDLLHRLRKRQTVRAHVQTTLRDLARELVADLGLTVQAAAPGPLWPRLIQHRQTDLDLLVELAERCGLFLTVRGDVLHLLTLAGARTRGPGDDQERHADTVVRGYDRKAGPGRMPWRRRGHG